MLQEFPLRRIWQIMWDEPLIPFALVGGVLFVVYGFRRPGANVETIEVRPATIRALEQMQPDIVGRPLTHREKQEIVEGFILMTNDLFARARVRQTGALQDPVQQPSENSGNELNRENDFVDETADTLCFAGRELARQDSNLE